ncbi:MAG: HD domain-containing phosphohydrolase [Planctomycetota bacterium]
MPVIKKRHVLVVLIATVQAVCLGAATLVFNQWLRNSMRETVHDQVLADNVHTAQQMTTLIRQMDVEGLRDDRESWRRLQSIVHDIKLPNDGFVCVVDATDGSLICHPALGDGNGGTQADSVETVKPEMIKPEMIKPEMVKPEMVKPEMVKPEMIKPDMIKPDMIKPEMVKPGMIKPETVEPPRDLVSGSVVEYGGELQIIAAAYVPELDANVNVHQKAIGIERNIRRLLRPVIPIGFSVSVALMLCTTLVLLAIMRLYDNRLASINENLERLVAKRTKSLRRVRDAVIFGLAKLAESRDTDTGEHLERIGLYVSVLAAGAAKTRNEIDTRYINNLSLASSLHDIGKVGIPDAILLKPGRFEPEERSVMETHAMLGGDCLKAIGDELGEDDFLQLSREIAYCHHEKWDGSGYPFGISGDAIPFSARLVALADVYDALRSRRPYKEPMSHEKARDIITDGSDSHFDPMVVDIFLETEETFVKISEKYNMPTSHCVNERSPQLEMSCAAGV